MSTSEPMAKIDSRRGAVAGEAGISATSAVVVVAGGSIGPTERAMSCVRHHVTAARRVRPSPRDPGAYRHVRATGPSKCAVTVAQRPQYQRKGHVAKSSVYQEQRPSAGGTKAPISGPPGPVLRATALP